MRRVSLRHLHLAGQALQRLLSPPLVRRLRSLLRQVQLRMPQPLKHLLHQRL